MRIVPGSRCAASLFAAVLLTLVSSVLLATTEETATPLRYRIFITNDDGVESEGLQQLARAVAKFADVVVVAPALNESGASQSSRILRGRAVL